MRKLLSAFTLILLSLSLTSCGALLTGMLMGMSSYPASYNSWNTPSWDTPSWDSPSWSNPTCFPYQPPVAPSWGSTLGSYSVPESSPSFSSSSSSSSSPTSTHEDHSTKSTKLCPICTGLGKCESCHGSGKRTDNMFGTGTDYSKTCGVCGGNGICPHCHGNGRR